MPDKLKLSDVAKAANVSQTTASFVINGRGNISTHIRKRVMAVALALWECIPAPTMTKAQLRSRAKAIYKGLV